MFNRKINITTIAALAAVMSLGVTSAQAHRVEITRKGEIKVSNTDATTKVVTTKSGGYRRVVVTSLVERLRPDGSTGVYEVITSAKVRIEKCPKRAKRCVQQQLKNGPDRLIKVIPASPLQSSEVAPGSIVPTSGSALAPTPAPDTVPTPTPAYPKPVVTCTFPEAWIIPSTPGYEFVSTGTIWCEVMDSDADPVKHVRALSPSTGPSRFVPTEYRYAYSVPCPPDASCFRAAYPVTTPGIYAFDVTATTESGQQATFSGSAVAKEGYPGSNK